MTGRKHLILSLATALLLGGCSNHNEPQQAPSATTGPSATHAAPAAAARSVVERFGKRMQKISVLAPPDAVRGELPRAYGGLLSPKLLKTWQAHPDQAIGREGSSPWPDRIEVKQIDCTTGNACRATGEVDYITSNEVAHGGVFMRRAITLDLTDTAHGWRITAVHLEPARD